jgi:3-phosphoshikimate 1-carboxyvinyltransferase
VSTAARDAQDARALLARGCASPCRADRAADTLARAMASHSVFVRSRGPLAARARVPGSKSLTNRALLIAALARGESELGGALDSDDTRVMRAALAELGCDVRIDADRWSLRGCDGRFAAPARALWVQNSGTTARFLAAAAPLAAGPVVIDGNARMRERPIEELARALAQLGAKIEILGSHGCPPLRIEATGLRGGAAAIDASRSSQYVSAVLIAAPYAERDVKLTLSGDVLVSRPYVELTLEIMRAFGADAGFDTPSSLCVRAGSRYAGRRYAIEPDASAAAYPFCAAAIAGGSVRVDGIPRGSLQPDLALLGLLERMGCRVERGDSHATVSAAPGALRGIHADMNDLPDAVLALAVVALFAEGPTRIRNVANLRIKETDRLAALEAELAKLGARVRTGADWIEIEPGPVRGAAIRTYDDHRMAMAFALAGLRIPGVEILGADCVSKTWPGFFEALETWN